MTKRSVDSMTMTDATTPNADDDDAAAAKTTARDRRSSSKHRVRGSLATLLSRPTPFPNEEGALPNGEFEPSTASSGTNGRLATARVLVVGAGGLGCEILKNLAMSGVRRIDVVDLDTIDVTNLNRQFLFRQKDVGESKAKVAAAFVRRRCPWTDVTAHHGPIQDLDADFYRQFDVVISGLDNVEARRWLNSLLCGLVELDEDGDVDPTTVVPMIDGGSEGFKGQARVILPRITSCFECTLDMFPPQQTFPLCTIAETPRKPEHCVAYASMILWDREFPDKKLDKDSPVDMTWVYDKAKERAETYGIAGVTYNLTMGVVKNIIPAVASTNAIVAAVCVNEAVKILTYCSQTLNTYFMYNGGQGIYSHTFVAERKSDCLVSSTPVLRRTLPRTATLKDLLENLKDEPTRLKNPSATTDTTTLYMGKPAALEKATRGNLEKTLLGDLVENGEKITITDETLAHTALTLTLTFE